MLSRPSVEISVSIVCIAAHPTNIQKGKLVALNSDIFKMAAIVLPPSIMTTLFHLRFISVAAQTVYPNRSCAILYNTFLECDATTEAKLPTHDLGVSISEIIITDCAPSALPVNLHSALRRL
jgi:hypothetical protein